MLKHQHLIVRAEVLRPPDDPVFIKKWLQEIIETIGMKLADMNGEQNPIAYYCNLPGNEGLTGIAVLETSSTTFHQWYLKDGVSLIEFDIYTCSCLDPSVIFEFFQPFEPTKIEYMFIDREHSLKILDSNVKEDQLGASGFKYAS